jgi:cytochrome c biogenesis protein
LIYQSSYGTVPDQGEVILSVAPRANAKKARKYKAEVGERFTLEDKSYDVKVKRFIPDFSMDKDNKVISRSQEPRNPAVQLALFKDNTLLYKKWIFKNFPDFHGSEEGDYRFTLLGFSGKEYTGLQLTKDPGVWTVWSGCFMLSLGCYLLFFMSHRRLWIKVESKNGEYLVTMAGTSNKNMLSFAKDFDQTHQELKIIGKSVPQT